MEPGDSLDSICLTAVQHFLSDGVEDGPHKVITSAMGHCCNTDEKMGWTEDEVVASDVGSSSKPRGVLSSDRHQSNNSPVIVFGEAEYTPSSTDSPSSQSSADSADCQVAVIQASSISPADKPYIVGSPLEKGSKLEQMVPSTAEMIGDTVEAVRRMRAEAAMLAFRLAEMHAQDARELRQVAGLMRQQVDSLQQEVQDVEAGLDELDAAQASWKSALQECLLLASLLGAAFHADGLLHFWLRWNSPLAGAGVRSRRQVAGTGAMQKGGVLGLAALVYVATRRHSSPWQRMGHLLSGYRSHRAALRASVSMLLTRAASMDALARPEPLLAPPGQGLLLAGSGPDSCGSKRMLTGGTPTPD